MEPFTHLLTYLSGLGLSPLNIVLIGMLYFLGAKQGIFPKLWKQSDEGDQEEEAPAWAQQLLAYYNHDTTGFHEKTHEKLDTLLAMEKEEHAHAQETRDILKENGYILKGVVGSVEEIRRQVVQR